MDMSQRLVFETEGKHGADIRGWNGANARALAEEHERKEYEREEMERMYRDADNALKAEIEAQEGKQ